MENLIEVVFENIQENKVPFLLTVLNHGNKRIVKGC